MSHVTPGRRTHVIFDEDRPVVVEPPYTFSRVGPEIRPATIGDASNLQLIPEIGWRLGSSTYQVDQQAMTLAGYAGIQTLELAPNHVVIPAFGQDPFGSYVGAQPSGNGFVQKRVAKGQSYNQSLLADATAEPVPDLGAMTVLLDRVAKTIGPQPDTLRDFHFDLVINRSSHDTLKEAASIQFFGPVGNTLGPRAIGTGHYSLSIHTNGALVLSEKLDTGRWKIRDRWRFKTISTFQKVRLTIHLTVPHANRRYPYGQVTFVCGYPASNPLHDALDGPPLLERKAGFASDDTDFHVYTVPGFGSAPAVALGPQRININRNSRHQFQLAYAQYFPSATLLDGVEGLPFLTQGGDSITLSWHGELTPGSGMAGALIDATSLSELSVISSTLWSKTYQIAPGWRFYRAKFTLTSATGRESATLTGYRVTKEGRSGLSQPGAWELDCSTSPTLRPAAALGKIKIVGTATTPRDAHAQVLAHDLTNQIHLFANRGMIPQRIETEVDGDPTKRCVLHRGTIYAPQGLRKVKGSQGYASGRTFWSIDSTGMWDRLERATCPFLWSWGDPDPASPVQSDGSRLPYKATDAIWYMLQWAGFPPQMLNIPDRPLRLPPALAREVVLEPYASLTDAILRIARRFLGMKLVFMENWGAFGQWTLRGRIVPTANPLVRFLETGPQAGHVPQSLNSYPFGSRGEVQVPILAGTRKSWSKPLSFNRLVVSTTTLAGSHRESKMRQIWHNFQSFNFLGLPPSHPYYPSPSHPDFAGEVMDAHYVDASLDDGIGSGAWLNWLIRRLVESSGHTQLGVTFRSPLVLIHDPDQPGLRRSLVVDDLVAVGSMPYYVRQCRPTYTKDHIQLATYDLVRA